jgi:hypothetical protein
MPDERQDRILQRVRAHAFDTLAYDKRATTNLYLDEHTYEQGQSIGPASQKIVARRPSILVFADDNPRANFGHECRYLLYDPGTGDFHGPVPARFPPIPDVRQPKTLEPFHEPIRFVERATWFHRWPPIWRCPIIVPDGARYAILFSGMSNRRHLNDMEFLYRTLIDVYAFEASNIYALTYDGTLNTQDGVQTLWPGDGTAYRINITGQGNRAAFEAAVDSLKTRMHSRDTLLIHCNNHGDSDTPDGGITWVPGTAYLCTYPSWGNYYNADFSAKLAELPKFRQLIIMLEQCHSGGFNASILANSPATATSVASAATEYQNSYVTWDGNWDPFARDWIAAQAGLDPFGAALAFNPDADGDGGIQADEAYAYANAVRDPRDSPNFSQSSAAGADIVLGQQYRVWWWWCRILFEAIEKYRIKLPPEEYLERLHRIQPELAKLTARLDEVSNDLRREMKEKVDSLVGPAFK